LITLTVVALNDVPADGTLQAHFDELGGSIGRADTNHLVLPDPERMVSRIAAQVVYRSGGFAIIDRGSNPVTLNGRALVSGREAPLSPGDRLRICGYELSVSTGPSSRAAATDPFAELLGPAPRPASGQLVDPLEQARSPAASAPSGSRERPASVLPDDWDPFAPPAPSAPNPLERRGPSLGLDTGAPPPAALVPEFGVASANPSLDQLFGLGPRSGKDPLADSPLDAPIAQPNMAAEADPMRSLGSAPRATPTVQADNLSDLNRPFIPPPVANPAVPASAGPQAVMSWEHERDASQATWIAPARPSQAAAPAVAPQPRPVPPAPPAPPVAPSSPPTAGGAQAAELLDALRRGLAAPMVDVPALTPAIMELLGQLLREAVRGTVDMLNARATIKHELRADVTSIVPRNNNPLKFSPNADVALQHLLGPPARGFVPAVPAMRDAYTDLRAHQFGIMAGTQAVLEATIDRFDPAELQRRLGDASLLHTLLPVSRHARLWELFVEHFAGIRNDATEDFHRLFGEAFLKAYDEQVERLQNWSPPPRAEA
jgi:FHA domain-containing protein